MASLLQAIRDNNPPSATPTVAVVVTTFNDTAYLKPAIQSVLRQQHPANEIILVDDGSDCSPGPFISGFPEVRLITKQNGGLSSARNAGLRVATSEFITFLDADDRYEPTALGDGLRCFRSHPEAAMVYGAHRRIRSDGRPITNPILRPLGPDPYGSLLRSNLIGMHATVLYRREALVALGGFDETSLLCEDYDLYLRLSKSHLIASHQSVVAEYRWHGHNVSLNTSKMLDAALAVHNRHREQTGERLAAWQAGQAALKHWYEVEQPIEWGLGKEPSLRVRLAERLRSVRGRFF